MIVLINTQQSNYLIYLRRHILIPSYRVRKADSIFAVPCSQQERSPQGLSRPQDLHSYVCDVAVAAALLCSAAWSLSRNSGSPPMGSMMGRHCLAECMAVGTSIPERDNDQRRAESLVRLRDAPAKCTRHAHPVVPARCAPARQWTCRQRTCNWSTCDINKHRHLSGWLHTHHHVLSSTDGFLDKPENVPRKF